MAASEDTGRWFTTADGTLFHADGAGTIDFAASPGSAALDGPAFGRAGGDLVYLDGEPATREEAEAAARAAGLAGDALAMFLDAAEPVAEFGEQAPGDWVPHVLTRGPRKGQGVWKNTKTGAYRDEPPEGKGQGKKDKPASKPGPPAPPAKPPAKKKAKASLDGDPAVWAGHPLAGKDAAKARQNVTLPSLTKSPDPWKLLKRGAKAGLPEWAADVAALAREAGKKGLAVESALAALRETRPGLSLLDFQAGLAKLSKAGHVTLPPSDLWHSHGMSGGKAMYAFPLDNEARGVIAPGPVDPGAGKASLDYRQKNPGHPVAQAIAADGETRGILQAFADKVAPVRESSERFGALRSAADELWRAYDAMKPPEPTPEQAAAGVKKAKNPPGLYAAREKWWRAEDKAAAAGKELAGLQDGVRRDLIALVKTDTPLLAVLKKDPGKTIELGGYAGKPVERFVVRKPYEPTPKEFSQIDRAVRWVQAMTAQAAASPPLRGYVGQSAVRAYYSHQEEGHGVINIGVGFSESYAGHGRNSQVSTIIHELGHAVEYQKPGLMKKAQEFLEYRLAGEQPADMGKFGMPGEMGRKDDFGRAFGESSAYYVGKKYDSGATEVLSMGLEKLYTDPVGFIHKDPEYAHFVIACLRSRS
jgi:hypothetical protein